MSRRLETIGVDLFPQLTRFNLLPFSKKNQSTLISYKNDDGGFAGFFLALKRSGERLTTEIIEKY
jgi:hypothetical protein